jgi:multisubunit Na+/H+ antiporter MnhG subunit
MTARDIAVDVLLAVAVAIVLASSVGVLVMRDAYQKTHYLTPAGMVAPVLVGAAVLVRSGLTIDTAQTGLALLFVLIASPFLSHATIRAIRIRQTGDWRPAAGRRGEAGGGDEAGGRAAADGRASADDRAATGRRDRS